MPSKNEPINEEVALKVHNPAVLTNPIHENRPEGYKTREEETNACGDMCFTHIEDVMAKARDKTLCMDDIDALPADNVAKVQVAAFRTLWDEEKGRIGHESYAKTLKELMDLDSTGALFKDLTPWNELKALVDEGETFVDHKQLQLFQDMVNEVVRGHYTAIAPDCTRCKLGLCPLPQGMPELASLPPQAPEHQSLSKLVSLYTVTVLKGQPSLEMTIVRLYKKELIAGALWALGQSLPPFVPILLFPRLIDSLVTGEQPLWHAYIYAGIVFITCAFMSVCLTRTNIIGAKVAVMLRGCLGTVVTEKALKATSSGWQSAGGYAKVFTLLHADVERVFQNLQTMLALALYLPTQLLLAVCYLGYVVSWTVLAGILVLCVTTPMSYRFAQKLIEVFTERMLKADSRTKTIHELIENIRGVKFYGWENAYIDQILTHREPECEIIASLMKVIARMLSLTYLSPFVFQVAILVTYALWDEDGLTTERVFELIALTQVIRASVRILPFCYSTFVQSRIAFTRVQDFLCKDETETFVAPAVEDHVISASDCSFSWTKKPRHSKHHVADKEEKVHAPILKDVNFKAEKGELVIVVGKVGTGKSTFLQGLLGEVTEVTGEKHVGGKVAYCPQAPWILSGSVRDNIEWGRRGTGLPFSVEEYEAAMGSVALLQDLSTQFQDGDTTLIGEKGINISGGQKARVALARAVYSEADLYLLDDVLSAVDAHVGMHIFEHAIKGSLAGKTRVLVTNQMQYAEYADRVYSVERAADGTDSYTLLQVDPKNPPAGSTFAQLFDEFRAQQADSANTTDEDEEEKKKKATLTLKLTPEVRDSVFKQASYKRRHELTAAEDIEEGSLSLKTYTRYFAYYGGKWWWAGFFLGHLLFTSCERMSEIWLGWWTTEGTLQTAAFYEGHIIGDKSTFFWIGNYVAMLLLGILIFYVRELNFANGAVRPCRLLYKKELDSVVGCPVSFFDTTPVGRILTRFVNDWEALDFLVPLYSSQVFLQFAQIIGSLIMVCLTLPMFTLMFIPIAAALWYVTTRDAASIMLRRFFNVTKSPVSNIFAENLRGLPVIRAFHKQQGVLEDQIVALNINHAMFLSERYAFEWVRFRVTLLAAVVMGSIILLLIAARDEMSASALGIVISQGVFVVLGVSQAFVMRQQLDLAMASTERVIEYCDLEPEEAHAVTEAAPKPPQDNWVPPSGKLEIRNMSVRYRPELPLALHSINLTVEGGHKVGIVGRTGSGKSTLLKSLFRLMHPDTGYSLTIDGVDVTGFSIRDLRKLFAIIPQEPVLLAGTIRRNVDPFNES
eukprot:TRINITY_DN211_c0_g1_i4.p1 TRINITY_DN211_c0_g1~~TRINITY_DN211_c0_g1_i4.p1  ORF type:complete len:1298 (+),score=619.13 TRINITY_DN211_c0_g1_i4:274-4167(+)